MSDLDQIRESFAQVLDEMSSAELVYSETLDLNEKDGHEKRFQILTGDDEIEDFIIATRHRAETIYAQSTRRLGELKLRIDRPAPFTVPENLAIEEIHQLLRQLLEMCQSVFEEI